MTQLYVIKENENLDHRALCISRRYILFFRREMERETNEGLGLWRLGGVDGMDG